MVFSLFATAGMRPPAAMAAAAAIPLAFAGKQFQRRHSSKRWPGMMFPAKRWPELAADNLPFETSRLMSRSAFRNGGHMLIKKQRGGPGGAGAADGRALPWLPGVGKSTPILPICRSASSARATSFAARFRQLKMCQRAHRHRSMSSPG